jgi:hypothetical protein
VESLLSMCSIYDRHVMSILSFASSFCSQLVLCKLYCSAKNPVEMCLLNWDAFWALSALLRIWQCIWNAPSKLESDIHYLSVPSIFKRALLLFGRYLPLISGVCTLFHFQEFHILFGCALPSVRPLVEGITRHRPTFQPCYRPFFH